MFGVIHDIMGNSLNAKKKLKMLQIPRKSWQGNETPDPLLGLARWAMHCICNSGEKRKKKKERLVDPSLSGGFA